MNQRLFFTKNHFFKALMLLPYMDKIILYGSRARGDAKPRSDIDLAFVTPRADDKDWLHIVDILDEADTLLRIDGVRYDNLLEDSMLKHAIDAEGVVLYEAKQD